MKRADILTKKATLEILEQLFGTLDYQEDAVNTTYGKIEGTLVPKTRWNSETHERETVYDENGEVVMTEEWGDIPKKPEEFDDEDRAKLAAIKAIKAHLEKLI